MDHRELFAHLDRFHIETPSWGYADSGTRFSVFPQDAAARTLAEKIEDAAAVHRHTGCCPSMAVHIPWDNTDDWASAAELANAHGIRFGAVNPNLFQDPCYKYGSFGNRDPAVRARAIAALRRCSAIATEIGSRDISCWFADGTNYPGQDDMRARKRRFEESFRAVYKQLPADQRLLIEYKFFEPAFYHTDLCDWGQCALLCRKLGQRATVLVDTGHHAPGTNVEHIVATLLDEGLLGGFHLNSRKYADDDLTVGSIDPHATFLICNELVAASLGADATARSCAAGVAYMLDQSHNLKDKVAATIQSVVFCQEAYAKALLVDREALAAARAADDVIGAEEVLRDAWNTDVRPLLRTWREERGLHGDPLAAFRRSDARNARAQRATVSGATA